MSQIETIVRETLCKTLKRPPSEAKGLKLEESLAYAYGLTSLDLIMLMTAVCATAGVPLTEFTEDDIAQVRTPADIVNLLRVKAPARGDA